MAIATRAKSLARRLRDRLLRRSLSRFRYDLPQDERTLLVRMDLINRCNMRCFMCPYSASLQSNKAAEVMSVELFRRIADQLFRHAYHLALSCAYEPLLHPRFAEILEITSRYGVPEWGIVTNGSLLDEQIALAMVRSRMSVVSVSLDAVRAETYQGIRGVDAFDRVLANVRALQELKRREASQLPRLFMNFVLMRRNIGEVVPYLQLCRELGAEEVTFVHVIPRSPENAESLVNDPDAYERVYREARRLADQTSMRVMMPAPFTEEELRSAGRPERERRLQQLRSDDLLATGARTTSVAVARAGDDVYCASPWMMLFISPNGDVHPCSHRQNDRPFGNLARASFEEIWNGREFLQLRRRLYYHDLEGLCLTCEAATPNSEPMVRRPIRIF